MCLDDELFLLVRQFQGSLRRLEDRPHMAGYFTAFCDVLASIRANAQIWSPGQQLTFGGNFMMFAIVSRDRNSGIRLLPHRYQDNRDHASLGKEGPYILVSDDRDIPCYLANGYSVFSWK